MKLELTIFRKSSARAYEQYKLMRAEQGRFNAARFISGSHWGFVFRAGPVQFLVTELCRSHDQWRRFDHEGQ